MCIRKSYGNANCLIRIKDMSDFLSRNIQLKSNITVKLSHGTTFLSQESATI